MKMKMIIFYHDESGEIIDEVIPLSQIRKTRTVVQFQLNLKIIALFLHDYTLKWYCVKS